MPTTIVTRAGKGSELTWDELDANFTNTADSADAAVSSANTAVSTANGAVSTANTASANASNAVTTANAAMVLAENGILTYSTRALLYADLAHPEGTPALVTNDITSSYNTFYVKSGASGSGSWVVSTISFGGTWGAVTGTLSNQTDLQNALNAKAPISSPTFTDTPAAPTAAVGTNTTQIATTAFSLANGGSATTTTFTPAGSIAAINVQTAIEELDAEKQPLDTTLTALAGVTTAADKIIYATASDVFSTSTLTSFARTLLDDADAATARTTLSVQPLDATLTALAGVTTAADQFIYATASDAFSATSLTSFARTLLDDADADTMRTTLGAASSAAIESVKAWVNFNGTGTVAILASYNVSSITDNGTGDYTVNFTTALTDANYAIGAALGEKSGDFGSSVMKKYGGTLSTTACQVTCKSGNGATLYDFPSVSLQFFR